MKTTIDQAEFKVFNSRWSQAEIILGADDEGEFIDVAPPGYIFKRFRTIKEAEYYCDVCNFYDTSAERGGWTGD